MLPAPPTGARMRLAPLVLLPAARLSDPAQVVAAATLFTLAAAAAAALAPPLFWLLLAAAAAACIGGLALRFTPQATAAWLVVTGASLEMAAIDWFGPDAFQPTIAAMKGAGLGLALLAALRYGPRLDPFNPAFAWLAMAVTGLVHGLWPGMTAADSLRSLVGSVAPFAFGFSRLSPSWARSVIRATIWAPLLSVAAAALCSAAGLRPLFVESGGLRLAGLGHPAFLAGTCEAAVYAALIELYRRGGHRALALLGANLLLLMLTGARAPLSLALGVVGLSLLLVRAPAFPARARRLLILGGLACLPPIAVLLSGLVPSGVASVRAFQVLTSHLEDLSGRQLLWPAFERAADASPWFGWGVGAGNFIIPAAAPVARLLQTAAAHNEYLRVAVEGGQPGRALLVLCFVLWARRHTAALCHAERCIMRLVFVAIAVHAVTDNLLISTPACVLFAFVTAVFARGAWERIENAA
jgi:O-antigen ligase